MDSSKQAAQDHVHAIMDQTGWTSTELARRAGVAASTINRFLNQNVKYTLSYKTLSKVNVAFSDYIALEEKDLQKTVESVDILGDFLLDETPRPSPKNQIGEQKRIIALTSELLERLHQADLLDLTAQEIADISLSLTLAITEDSPESRQAATASADNIIQLHAARKRLA